MSRLDNFEAFLHQRFDMNLNKKYLNFHKLTKEFQSLTMFELDIIKHAVATPKEIESVWSKIPLYSKQLQYYLAYGKYGPRSHLSCKDIKSEISEKELQPPDKLSRFVIMTFCFTILAVLIKDYWNNKDHKEAF